MSYTTDDFTESLSRVAVEQGDIAAVEAAWGKGDGQGSDAGHFKWSDEGVSDWAGGFLLRMKDGGYVYITGWCDYTGWGCQDGATVYRFTERPALDSLRSPDGNDYNCAPAEAEWDIEPADLNRVLTNRSNQ